ncbi:MAG: hypothetical protein IIB69_01630 [Proteobacteria bacterium]|nr:hypothetical protein [Pseudomonadota bacterium]
MKSGKPVQYSRTMKSVFISFVFLFFFAPGQTTLAYILDQSEEDDHAFKLFELMKKAIWVSLLMKTKQMSYADA